MNEDPKDAKLPNVNTDVTTESESRASENPVPGTMPEAIVEPLATTTKENVVKEVKKRKGKQRSK